MSVVFWVAVVGDSLSESSREATSQAMAKPAPPAFVYRISTADEWAEFQRTGTTLGGDLDRSTGCIHLSDLSQVR
jgi:hypothetical protein